MTLLHAVPKCRPRPLVQPTTRSRSFDIVRRASLTCTLRKTLSNEQRIPSPNRLAHTATYRLTSSRADIRWRLALQPLPATNTHIAKVALSQSPPGLHFPGSTREGSVESGQSISTPVSASYNFNGRKTSDRDLLYSAYERRGQAGEELTSDDLLFPEDDRVAALPLFSTASPFTTQPKPMAAGSASPITIGRSSSSPHSQQSNYPSQSRQPRIDISHEGGMDGEQQHRGRQESLGVQGTTPYGARSIPSKDGYRGDSNGLSGSLMTGMSWGGISVGSYIRDEWVACSSP